MNFPSKMGGAACDFHMIRSFFSWDSKLSSQSIVNSKSYPNEADVFFELHMYLKHSCCTHWRSIYSHWILCLTSWCAEPKTRRKLAFRSTRRWWAGYWVAAARRCSRSRRVGESGWSTWTSDDGVGVKAWNGRGVIKKLVPGPTRGG